MKYRAEIDGLRAFAVVPVIFYHAGFSHFDGGFVGVDIFLVISGYLITSILMQDKEEGRLSLINFYERRARRILPALVVVVAACIPAALAIMTPAQMMDFAQSVLAVSFFLSNVFFWQESGYFEAASELKPLLHTWSLSVEEQFYIFFPVLFLTICTYRRTLLGPILVILFLVSISLSEWGWRNAPSGNFFLTPSRAWELLTGSLCAIATRQGVQGNEWLSVLGFTMIVVSITLFDKTTPFPSLYTLLPVIGTAFVILFSSPKTITGRMLSMPFLVWLGLLSYSAYLWHNPLFAFARLELGRDPSLFLYTALIGLTFVLAYLSWRFVEAPFRRRSGQHSISRRGIFTFAAIASVGMLTFGIWGHVTGGWRDAYLARLPKEQQVMFTLVEQVRREHVKNAEGRFDNGDCIFDVRSINEATRQRLRECARRHGPGVLILGDSHAIDLYGAIIEAESTGEPFIVGIVSGGCRPHTPAPECAYEEVSDIISAGQNVFEIIIYTQAGFHLLRGHGFDVGSRSMFAEWSLDAVVPAYEPHRERLSAVRDYLDGLANHVPVVWLSSRVEPHVHQDLLEQQGCEHAYKLRPGAKEVFMRLESEISALLAKSKVNFLSQFELLNLSFPEDLLSCEELYWSDGDHFSNAGEKRFGRRMKIIKNARKVSGT